MRSKPRVAAVIPAFNHERFVDEAIRSVVEQTWQDLELVIVDDGSQDATLKRCRAWAQQDSRIRVLKQVNQGSHAAINRGVQASHADIVLLLNSDDRWAPDRVERVMQEFDDDQAQFVVTGVRLIDAQGQAIEDPSHWWNRTQADFRQRAHIAGPVAGLLYGNYTVSTSNFAFRRSLWTAVGRIPARRMIPDWDWAIRAALHAPEGLRFLADEYLLDYRLHGGNAILSRLVLGDLEVGLLHRNLLTRLGVPVEAVLALFRNQRDLRRHARRLGQEQAEHVLQDQTRAIEGLKQQLQASEGFVRQRELDLNEVKVALKAVQAAQAAAESRVRERETDVQTLQEQLGSTEALVRQREGDVQQLQTQLGRTEAFLREREADVAQLQQQRTTIEDLVRQREGDVQQLQTQLGRTEAFLREREGDVAQLQQQRTTIEDLVRQREGDVQQLQTQLGRTEAFLREREADVAHLQQQLASAEGFVRQREQDLLQLRASAADQERTALILLQQRDTALQEIRQHLDEAERFVRAREADVQGVSEERDRILGFLRDREADLRSLQAEHAAQVRAAEAVIRDLRAHQATIEDLLQTREAALQALTERSNGLKALVDEADSSWIWRHLRQWRRRWGWRRI